MSYSEPSPLRFPLLFLLLFVFLFAIVVNYVLMERLSRPIRYHRQQAGLAPTFKAPEAVALQPVGNPKNIPEFSIRLVPRSI